MYSSLMPFMLGIHPSFAESIELAARHGFAGVDVNGESLLSLTPQDIEHLRERFAQTSTRPGYVALPPGRLPVSQKDWDEAIAHWPRIARIASELGYTRSALVLLPFHESLDRAAALDEHKLRLQKAAPILGEYGIQLGLEYIPAPSRRAPYRTHTVWTLDGMLEFLDQVGEPNLGLMLDTFHWHGAGETADDLKKLRLEQIVVVHANDAPDIPLDQQVVTQRALPGATGVIDNRSFFQTLQELGYDGPVTCEPMQAAIDALKLQDANAICARVKQALDSVLSF
jgi:sugar phosphate isomerase/epimerase